MTSPSTLRTPQDFVWLTEQFAADTPGVTHAVLLSSDGLQLVSSSSVGRDLGDQLAALTSGLLSMADRSAGLLDLGASEYVTVRLPKGHLLFMRVGDAAGLAVAAVAGCDLRVVAYQMTQFVRGVGHLLSPQMRQDLQRRIVNQGSR
jgi:predicted regulator of Ras-like GTPase activity (Roadblock/LC7/MglB family)